MFGSLRFHSIAFELELCSCDEILSFTARTGANGKGGKSETVGRLKYGRSISRKSRMSKFVVWVALSHCALLSASRFARLGDFETSPKSTPCVACLYGPEFKHKSAVIFLFMHLCGFGRRARKTCGQIRSPNCRRARRETDCNCNKQQQQQTCVDVDEIQSDTLKFRRGGRIEIASWCSMCAFVCTVNAHAHMHANALAFRASSEHCQACCVAVQVPVPLAQFHAVGVGFSNGRI